MDSSPPPPPSRRSFPSVAATEDEEPAHVPSAPTVASRPEASPDAAPALAAAPAEQQLEQVSDDALAQAVTKRLHDFTELKARMQALEVALAEVVEENRGLKQKLTEKEGECAGLQKELGDMQLKMAEIITNITHLNEATTAERRAAAAAYSAGGRNTHA